MNGLSALFFCILNLNQKDNSFIKGKKDFPSIYEKLFVFNAKNKTILCSQMI